MKKYIFGTVLALGMFTSPLFASAAGLTSSQINAIIQLLQSFGADQSVISNVQISLNGGTPSSASNNQFCYNFDSDLGVGANGSAVTALQTALQEDGEPIVANGSFDEQTASAISGFQEKYASSVLTPVGLQHGTGYVGPSTRAKLNALYGCGSNQQQTQPTQPTTPAAVPVISSISPTQGTTADIATIAGTNLTSGGNPAVEFRSSNGTLTGVVYFINMNYISPSQLTFNLNATNATNGSSVTLQPGTYQVDVKTPNGTSNSVPLTVTTNVVASSGLTSAQIQAVLSLLATFGANSTTIANVTTVLNGGTVSSPAPSGLTSSQIQSITSLLTSFGANNTTIANVKSVISVATPPTVTLTAAPATIPASSIRSTAVTIASGGKIFLYFNATNAASCSAPSGNWSPGISGSYITSPITQNTTFSIQCTGQGGTSPIASISVTVTPAAPVITSVSFGTDVIYGTGRYIYTIEGTNLANVVKVKETHLVDGETDYTSFVYHSDSKIVFATNYIVGQAYTDSYQSQVSVVNGDGTESNTMPIQIDLATSAPTTGTGLKVSLSPMSPSGTVLFQGQSNADLGDFVFTNPTSVPISVTNLTFNRIGTSDNSTLTNLNLYNGSARISSNVGISGTQYTFSNNALFVVQAGGTYTVSIHADIAANTSPGQQVGINLSSVTINGTFDPSVTFPITTGYQTTSQSVSSPVPTITSTSAKAAGNFEMDAGGTASISGSNFPSNATVYIGGQQATVTSDTSTLLWINVPSNLAVGGTYPLYVTGSNGTSNIVQVNILSNLAAPTISSISPISVTQSGTVTVYGTNFDSGSYVEIAGISVTPTILNSGTLTFVVPTQVSASQTYQFQIAEKASTLISNYSPILTVTSSVTVSAPISCTPAMNKGLLKVSYSSSSATISWPSSAGYGLLERAPGTSNDLFVVTGIGGSYTDTNVPPSGVCGTLYDLWENSSTLMDSIRVGGGMG